ncbi:TRAP-type C4-dicarboxylate transport system, small permease component [Sulfitobacter marinus]|uniref:TRAP transporter small permease protein n=1 Tax=Sulfitobacter marinus TaxID=394264 RepID=A0A1I6QHC5_9RHOB|nr:TRAP transporter small permease [Sulfitobacter marinus]SFS51824.1 TRAP-type C4-dicarboxylate transport system, small permease component [Sulfitobacter marinus]
MFRHATNFGQRVETVCAVLLLVAIVVLVAIASIARVVGSPIIWSVEIAQLCLVWLCMLSADLAMQNGRHFGLSLLSDALSPARKRLLELFNRAVLIILLGLLLYYAWHNAHLMHPRLIGATQMHGSYLHASMVVGLCLLLRTMIAQTYAVWRGTSFMKDTL